MDLLRSKTWRLGWMTAAGLAIPLVIASLFYSPVASVAAKRAVALPKAAEPPVRLSEDGSIVVATDSPLRKRMTIVEVSARETMRPLVTVTGSVIARVRSQSDPSENRWQFSTSELSTAYADWLRSQADLEFAKGRLQKTKDLVAAQESHYQAVVDRLAVVAESGVALKDVSEAKANLLQSQLQGEKDIYAEESNVRIAQQQHSLYERELAQLGIEPLVLDRAREGMLLIAAHVPESKVSLVHEHQACEARFYGFPETVYSAHVESLGTILNVERRTLRVLFDVTDEQNKLRPGMFADVYLGTEKRSAILVDLAAIIHVGHSDYAFRERADGNFDVVKVVISEPYAEMAEVVSGLADGDRVVTSGAILLKPLALQSLAR